METQLFNLTEWDQIDPMMFMFYGCTFNTDVGKYKKGDTASSILMDYSQGIIQIFDESDDYVEYKLSFLIR